MYMLYLHTKLHVSSCNDSVGRLSNIKTYKRYTWIVARMGNVLGHFRSF
jgi:hypothetical protein